LPFANSAAGDLLGFSVDNFLLWIQNPFLSSNSFFFSLTYNNMLHCGSVAVASQTLKVHQLAPFIQLPFR
jgi:hypothetical protein